MINEELDAKLEYKVIDYYCTFEYLLKYIDVDFPNRTCSCFCPFHDNSRTKAAKVFVEEHNEHIFCFAENKLYKPHHLLTNNIVPFTVSHVFSSIWTQLSDNEKNIFSGDTVNKEIKTDFSQYYMDYKRCKIKYEDLLSILRNSS